jgi:phage tail tube protein FII
MPKKVYCNVVDHRLLDSNTVIEDVTKVGLPTIKHKTVQITNVAGVVMDIDMPDMTHFEASEYTITHNNGVNCNLLSAPEKHTQEFRVARQKYDTTQGVVGYESVKYRLVGAHVQTEKGDIETGSPYGSTEHYSLLRYEEEIDGNVVTIIDSTAGVIKYNGKSYTDNVQNLLK